MCILTTHTTFYSFVLDMYVHRSKSIYASRPETFSSS